jgi:outer membrane receptor protein involved in Fe transport
VDVTGRNDWSSTLPEGNNSYFYPSVSSAFVFTDAFGLQSDMLSSGKVRASWTRVGNDASPYQLTSVFTAQQGWGGIPMFAVPNTLANADLKPEETTAWEIGTDLGFLDERRRLRAHVLRLAHEEPDPGRADLAHERLHEPGAERR